MDVFINFVFSTLSMWDIKIKFIKRKYTQIWKIQNVSRIYSKTTSQIKIEHILNPKTYLIALIKFNGEINDIDTFYFVLLSKKYNIDYLCSKNIKLINTYLNKRTYFCDSIIIFV